MTDDSVLPVNPVTLISRILVPVDGSREGLDAVAYAVQLSRALGARRAGITLLHVVEVFRLPLYVPGLYPKDQEDLRGRMLGQGRAILEFTRMRFHGADVPVETKLREGSPGEAIVEEALSGHYDVIVMGAHGIGSIQNLLIGSVSNHVANDAPCPVIIVRGEWPGKPDWAPEASAG